VSEGASPQGGQAVYRTSGDAVYFARLGGIGQEVGKYIEAQGFEARVTVLGHLQRGGSPTAFDRWLASRYGAAAVRTAAAGGFGQMVALSEAKVIAVPLREALAIPKRVNLDGDAITTARGLGISFGDA
jgi:6-phosphofructokinase